MGCGNSSALITNDETRNYCYSLDEINKIDNLILLFQKEPELNNQKILYHKYFAEINQSDEIFWKEYITIFTHENNYPFSGIYKYKSNKFNSSNININEIKVNNILINNYKIEGKGKEEFSIDIPYTLNIKDNQCITFELSYNYKRVFSYFFVIIPFEIKDDHLFSLTITSLKYMFNNRSGQISGNNFLDATEKSQRIFLFGNERQGMINFLFMNCQGINLDNFDSFYNPFDYLGKERKLMESCLSNIKYNMYDINIVSVKDEIHINSGTKNDLIVYKTILAGFIISDRNILSTQSFPFEIRSFSDLKIISYKINNMFQDDEQLSLKDYNDKNKYVQLRVHFQENEYFVKIEIEYCFTLDYDNKKCATIPLKHHDLLEGGLYQLYIKNDGKSIGFYRDDIEDEDNYEYSYIIKLPYKKYNDNFEFNYLYIYNY